MVDPQMGREVLAFVFMIAIIGGLDSIEGTLIGEEPGRRVETISRRQADTPRPTHAGW